MSYAPVKKEEFCDRCRAEVNRYTGIYSVSSGKEGLLEAKNRFKLCPECYLVVSMMIRKQVIGK